MKPSLIFRYFFQQQVKTFALFVFSFCLLYVLLDFSMRFKWFTFSLFSFQELIWYYLYNLLTKAYILLPLASLLTTLRLLSHSVASKELIALLAGGLNYRIIFTPFWVFNALCILLLYANSQWVIPQAASYIYKFEDRHFHGLSSHPKEQKLHQLHLQDDSKLLFKVFHPSNMQLEDVFWIQSFEKIMHMKYLDLAATPPTGYFIDLLEESDKQVLFKSESFTKLPLTQLQFYPPDLSALILPPSVQAISELFSKLPASHQVHKDEEAIILTHFHYKLALPFSLLFTFFLPYPHLINFSRRLPLFYIFSFSLIAFISFFMILESFVILAESNVLYPPLAIWLPFCALWLISWVQTRKLS